MQMRSIECHHTKLRLSFVYVLPYLQSWPDLERRPTFDCRNVHLIAARTYLLYKWRREEWWVNTSYNLGPAEHYYTVVLNGETQTLYPNMKPLIIASILDRNVYWDHIRFYSECWLHSAGDRFLLFIYTQFSANCIYMYEVYIRLMIIHLLLSTSAYVLKYWSLTQSGLHKFNLFCRRY